MYALNAIRLTKNVTRNQSNAKNFTHYLCIRKPQMVFSQTVKTQANIMAIDNHQMVIKAHKTLFFPIPNVHWKKNAVKT